MAVSISYRLNQGNIATDGIPAAVSDARQAVAWVHDHATEYRIDTERVTIGGSSAGAITSLFVAYTETEKDPGAIDSGVAAVMDLWGGLYIAVDEMETGEPPLAIIHGTEDVVVPFSEAEKLRDRAEEVGVPYAWHPIAGAGHAPWDPTTHMTWTAEFFYDQLWGEAPTPTATSEPPTPTATATATEPPVTATPTESPPPSPSATEDPDADGVELFIPWAER
jgi:acetyl esterase/lipase